MPADSPRLGGVDEVHVTLLAERLAELPPILVHRQTMRVIDGMHRVRAATRARHDMISARFFDGSEEEAFARSVELNVRHGLPLSLADRKAAARRILTAFPKLSDRAIAAKTGLSDKTVAAIRRDCPDAKLRQTSRVGRDGRRYPTDSAERRERVMQLIYERPNASLRVLAAAAGVSPGTVSQIRKRMETEPTREPSIRSKQTGIQPLSPSAVRGRGRDAVPPNVIVIMENLCRDPSLRDRDAGRKLLRWLSRYVVDVGKVPDISAIPPHCVTAIAQLAHQTANTWLTFARGIEAMACEDREPLRAV